MLSRARLSPLALGFALLACAGPDAATSGTRAPGAPPASASLGPKAPTSGASPTAAAPSAAPLRVRLLAFNDFHGHLKPPTGKVPGVDGPVGGAAYFAAHLRKLGAGRPGTIVVAAGDLVGGSPLTSALFHDEPTVLAMNAMGLDVLAVGNHELDEGLSELLRLKNGGCHAKDGCVVATTYPGARFALLGANVFDAKSGARMLPPFVVREVEGVPIAFIGMTLEGTPNVVAPSGVEGLAFRDEARTVAELMPEIRARGVRAIVLLVHEGGLVKGGGLDDCNDLHGPITKIVDKLDPDVDVVISGHTHALYNCRMGHRPVTSALSFGRVITAIDLTIDRATKDIVETKATNHPVTHDVVPDAEVASLVDKATTLAAPLEGRVIGRIARTIRADSGASGESPLGSLIADAQLEATKKAGATVAVMNSGGLRADLVFAKSGSEPEDGIVTYGEAFSAQPFGNVLITLTLTGADLLAFLEDEVKSGAVVQVSRGLTYRIKRRSVTAVEIDGKPLAKDARIRLTVNNFLADTSPPLKKIKERVMGPRDLDALEAYFKAHALVDVPKPPRITRED